MTLNEAAAILGTTPDNLRGAIKRGSLRAVKHGRDWWLEPKEVDRYKAENLRGKRPR
jgi:excisionase family DNA binding protein